jgi:1-acyl-sn-glycerol-3-phosphate acyltransferase
MLFRWILKRLALAALWFRFRKKQLVFHAPPPLHRGAILAANHQNAVLDSITLAACSPRIPFTLSRASLFDNRILRYLLNAVRNIPIYRFRDGFGKMRRNPQALAQFADILRDGEWLAIYPEGSHLIRHTLRPLQKGVARIAFAAQEAQGWEREIPIVPVGFQYEHHTGFGARVLLQFGPPISSLAFREAHADNPKKAERELTDEVFEGIEPLLILPPQDDEGYRAAVARMEANRDRFPDLMDQFRSDREVVAEAMGGPGGRPSEVAVPEGGGEACPNPNARGRAGVNGGGGPPRRGGGLRKFLGYALSLPGQVLHLPASLVTMAVVSASTKDPHLAPSARFLTAMFLVPLWYLGVLAFLHLRFQSIRLDLLALVMLPGSLWLWSRCWHWTW